MPHSPKKLKVNIVVGARFNASKVVEILAEQSELYDVVIYTSSKKSNWGITNNNVGYVFVPHISAIIGHLSKRQPPMWLEDLSSILFDWFVSVIMRKCNILHVWSSYGLRSIVRAHKNDSIVFVDKACPHPTFQNALLKNECKILGVPYSEHSNFFTKRILAEFDLADLIVVPSNYTMKSFLSNDIPISKLHKVLLDANFAPKRSHIKAFISCDFVVGVIGGSIVRKGYVYLVKAWNELKLPNAKLLIKVSEAELKKYSNLYKEVKSNPSIEIVGYLDDIESFYERCHVFCLPTIDDGFGMVLLEAIACSTPVITTTNAGASELITEGVNGYVIEPFDHLALANKIRFLYDHRDILQKMSIMCRSSYDDYLKSDSSYKKGILSLYNNYTLDHKKQR